MPKMSIKLTGLEATLRGLETLPSSMNTGFSDAMNAWGKDVLQRSKQIVPVVTGALKNSGKVDEIESDGKIIKLRIGYGDAKAWYASIVHERLDVRHPNGQAKYLETPINENSHRLDIALVNALNKAMRISFRAA